MAVLFKARGQSVAQKVRVFAFLGASFNLLWPSLLYANASSNDALVAKECGIQFTVSLVSNLSIRKSPRVLASLSPPTVAADYSKVDEAILTFIENQSIQPKQAEVLLEHLLSSDGFRQQNRARLSILIQKYELPDSVRKKFVEGLDRGIVPDKGRREYIEEVFDEEVELHAAPVAPLPRSPKKALAILSQSSSPTEIFDSLTRTLALAPKYTPHKETLLRTMKKLREILFGEGEAEMMYRTQGVIGSNMGIAQYVSKELSRDPQYLSDSIRFYSKIAEHDAKLLPMGMIEPDDSGYRGLDVWKLAMEASEQDKSRALRVLGVFGHDDVQQSLFFLREPQSDRYLALLNRLVPKEKSILYHPVSFPAVQLPAKLRTRLTEMKGRFERLQRDNPHMHPEEFRPGHYHVLGAAFVANELIRAGLGRIGGVRAPVFLGENLGYFYKKLSLETHYLSESGRTLYQAGYRGKLTPSVSVPTDWTPEELEAARFNVDLNLLYLEITRQQHRLGASFAYNRLR